MRARLLPISRLHRTASPTALVALASVLTVGVGGCGFHLQGSGTLPPALAIGPGAELQRPMALSIVGGMIVSTAFTLFVVPAAYSLIDDAVAWNDARKSRGEGLVDALRAPRSA